MDIATSIFDDLIADLMDRKGLSDEWEQIDEDIQDEIKETWVKIIRGYIGGQE